jgi:hypothetical protein
MGQSVYVTHRLVTPEVNLVLKYLGVHTAVCIHTAVYTRASVHCKYIQMFAKTTFVRGHA